MNPEKSTVDRWMCAPALLLIFLYRRLLSPLLGSTCRFHPSCSRYARQAFERKGFWTACRLTVWRLARCHPFHPGGYDPLEPEREEPERVGDSPRREDLASVSNAVKPRDSTPTHPGDRAASGEK